MIIARRILLALLIVAFVVPAGFRAAALRRESHSAAALRPDTGRMVPTRMGNIYIEAAGPDDGPLLLLAHGTAAWSGLWAGTMAGLANSGYRIIAFDMPPFGFSDRAADADYRRQTQAKRILALIEALQDRPILIAHSFGAAPAAEAVMMDQSAFAGLILVDGAVGLGSHIQKKQLPLPLRPRWLRQVIVSLTGTNPLLTRTLLAKLLYEKSAATPDIVAILQRPMRIKGSTAAFADWLPSLVVPPADARSTRAENYQALSLPTRLIWGDRDSVTPPEQAVELARHIGQGPPHMLTNVGHIPQIEAPDAFLALLLSVLSDMKAEN